MPASLARVHASRRALALAGFLLAALTLALVQVGVAFAHANLLRAEPEVDAKLAQSPAELRLFFTQGLNQKGSYVQVKDASDREVAVQVSFDAADNKIMKASLPPSLPPGIYTVKWQSLSADDDDYNDGSYKLTVLNASGSASDDSGNDSNSNTTLFLAIGAGFAIAVAGGTAVALKQRGGKR